MQDSRGSQRVTEDERVWLTVLGILAVATVATASTWHRAVTWLLGKGLIVAAPGQPHRGRGGPPVVRLPAADGAGLDAFRLAVVVAVVVLVILGLVGHRRRRRAAAAANRARSGGQ